MEFVVNVFDYPQAYESFGVCRIICFFTCIFLSFRTFILLWLITHQEAYPVFSFSIGGSHMDILYPAWSFWKGGPVIPLLHNEGIGRWDLLRKQIKKRYCVIHVCDLTIIMTVLRVFMSITLNNGYPVRRKFPGPRRNRWGSSEDRARMILETR